MRRSAWLGEAAALTAALLASACAGVARDPLGGEVPGHAGVVASQGERTHAPHAAGPVASSGARVDPNTTAEVAPEPPRASAETTWESLPVEGFGDAVVVAPPDDGRPRPLVVVTHGAGGRPEVHCARWLEIVGSRAFLACTRGRSTSTHLPEAERGFFYDGHHELGRELDATFAALVRRHGARIDTKAAVFAGYSQGATMGILALHEDPTRAARFGGVVLVEGGTGDWNVALSERMRRLGVRRVAFVCGQASCIEAARRSRPWLERAGLPLRIEHAPGAGHTYGGAVAPLVEQAFAWVVEGDARFAPR